MSRRFMVSCDDCEFEQEATSREDAEAVAEQHLDQLGHEVVAVELPAKG